MRNRNFLSDRERELVDLSDTFEAARREGRTPYMDPDDMADLADWYGWNGKQDEALDVLTCGLSLHPDDPALLIQLTYYYIDSGQQDQAEEAFKDVARSTLADPDEVNILHANIALGQGDTDEMERLIGLVDIGGSLHCLIEAAYLYADSGRPRKAVALLTRYADDYRDEEAYTATMADCYRQAGRMDDAIRVYNQLLDRDPYNPSYWCALGLAYIDTEDYEKAIDAADYAIATDDDCTEAYQIRASAYSRLGNDDEVMACLRTMEERGMIDPVVTKVFHAIELVSKEDWAAALDLLEDIQHEADDDFVYEAIVCINAALCAHHLDRPDSALDYIDEVFDLVDTYDEAHSIMPSADDWWALACISAEMGELNYAQHALEEARRVDPNSETIRKTLDELKKQIRGKKKRK